MSINMTEGGRVRRIKTGEYSIWYDWLFFIDFCTIWTIRISCVLLFKLKVQ